MKTTLYRTLCVVVILISSVSPFASALSVTFINPGHAEDNPTGNFWPNVDLFMQQAAEDLNIELTILHANRNHILMKSLVDEALSTRPDYLILVNEQDQGTAMMEKLKRHKIPALFLLNGLAEESNDHAMYLGSVQPDNVKAGFNLARDLIAMALKQGHSQANILALEGDYQTPASQDRKIGMLAAIEQAGAKARLLENTVAFWSADKSFEKIYGLARRYKKLNTLWCANDPMAFGGARALTELKKRSDAVIGGINWDPQPDDALTDLSYGGHVTLGALALVMLYDLNHSDTVKPTWYKKNQIIDIFVPSDTVQANAFKRLLSEKNTAQIGFRRFSCETGNCEDFTIDNLVHGAQK